MILQELLFSRLFLFLSLSQLCSRIHALTSILPLSVSVHPPAGSQAGRATQLCVVPGSSVATSSVRWGGCWFISTMQPVQRGCIINRKKTGPEQVNTSFIMSFVGCVYHVLFLVNRSCLAVLQKRVRNLFVNFILLLCVWERSLLFLIVVTAARSVAKYFLKIVITIKIIHAADYGLG